MSDEIGVNTTKGGLRSYLSEQKETATRANGDGYNPFC